MFLYFRTVKSVLDKPVLDKQAVYAYSRTVYHKDRRCHLSSLTYTSATSRLPSLISTATLMIWLYFIPIRTGKGWKKACQGTWKPLLTSSLHMWRLKLSTEKTTSISFHLSNREAQRQLFIRVNRNILPHSPHPKYLGVKLDRQLTYRQHIEDLRGKVRLEMGE